MHIDDIEGRLGDARDTVLQQLGVPREALAGLEFEETPDPEMGDLGFPCFAFARHLERSPPSIAADVAEILANRLDDEDLVVAVEAEGPYVNIDLDPGRVAAIVVGDALDEHPFGGDRLETDDHWMVEFSGPNTNKPQHVGHLRNNLLGEAVASVNEFAGRDVVRTNIVNDRGIHICKSMVAYQLDDDPETPASSGRKGDHLVGDYYVDFHDRVDAEYEEWQLSDEADEEFEAWVDEERAAGRLPDDLDDQREQVRASFFETFRDDWFNEYSELGARAREMLRKWEEGDEEVLELWETMDEWVTSGFRETYERLDIEFDEVDRESDNYERGRDLVERGLEQGIFEERDDGAVVFDLDRLDMEGEKVVLRADGTTVYVTQDIGTADRRFEDHDLDRLVYVVGDEQEYHFQVLFGILDALDIAPQEKLHHLAYGLVQLPEGEMKSRRGDVVDADDLMDQMVDLAEEAVRERWEGLDDDEIARRAEKIGLGALKFHMLDFNARTHIDFDPEKTLDFEGRTGPYCQYSYARIQSIGRRIGGWPDLDADERSRALESLGTDREMEVVRQLRDWPSTIDSAISNLDPSDVTEYLFELAQSFSSLYNDPDHRIVELDGPRRDGLVLLARGVARTLETGLSLLGIETLEQM